MLWLAYTTHAEHKRAAELCSRARSAVRQSGSLARCGSVHVWPAFGTLGIAYISHPIFAVDSLCRTLPEKANPSAIRGQEERTNRSRGLNPDRIRRTYAPKTNKGANGTSKIPKRS